MRNVSLWCFWTIWTAGALVTAASQASELQNWESEIPKTLPERHAHSQYRLSPCLILSVSWQNILNSMKFTHFRESIPLSTLLSPTFLPRASSQNLKEKTPQLVSLLKIWINCCLFASSKNLSQKGAAQSSERVWSCFNYCSLSCKCCSLSS